MKEYRDHFTYGITRAAAEVHRTLGHGFKASVYGDAMALELDERGIPFDAEIELPVRYNGVQLRHGYLAALVCHETIIVELKSQPRLLVDDEAKAQNFLKATNMESCLLLNFGAQNLEYRRVVRNVRSLRNLRFNDLYLKL